MLKDLNPEVPKYLSRNHSLTVGASRPHVCWDSHLYESYGPTRCNVMQSQKRICRDAEACRSAKSHWSVASSVTVCFQDAQLPKRAPAN